MSLSPTMDGMGLSHIAEGYNGLPDKFRVLALVGQPAVRDFAPRVLEQLVTEQGTKRPRSEQELTASTSLRRGEVRAVLNGLGDAALARPLDSVKGSHSRTPLGTAGSGESRGRPLGRSPDPRADSTVNPA